MVFLIQKSQNKDSLAIQLKLNELVAAHSYDSNRLVDVEEMTEEELKTIAQYGNGLYQLFSSAAATAANVHNKLMTIGQTTRTGSSFGLFKSCFWYVLISAFVVFLIDNFLPEN